MSFEEVIGRVTATLPYVRRLYSMKIGRWACIAEQKGRRQHHHTLPLLLLVTRIKSPWQKNHSAYIDTAKLIETHSQVVSVQYEGVIGSLFFQQRGEVNAGLYFGWQVEAICIRFGPLAGDKALVYGHDLQTFCHYRQAICRIPEATCWMWILRRCWYTEKHIR